MKYLIHYWTNMLRFKQSLMYKKLEVIFHKRKNKKISCNRFFFLNVTWRDIERFGFFFLLPASRALEDLKSLRTPSNLLIFLWSNLCNKKPSCIKKNKNRKRKNVVEPSQGEKNISRTLKSVGQSAKLANTVTDCDGKGSIFLRANTFVVSSPLTVLTARKTQLSCDAPTFSMMENSEQSLNNVPVRDFQI